ncbi:MAG TPA: bifunctional hydroxymethylpyrimidine kinase/phosphomethylpyrimidine kinase [Thermoanaerobaculia bacterium]|nr:bifunctional hydroxymethylpyrimidine kinase/phosphomethylpyrimidine kinase [Thermoanaerobaculia bacterium]
MSSAAALSVGSLEAGGGGGLPADLKTFESLGVNGTSVATAVTTQEGSALTVLHDLPVTVVREQLRAARQAPPPKAVKVGLVTTVPVIRLLAADLPGLLVPIVVDPEMTGNGEPRLLRQTSISALARDLLPAATIVTPNLVEASVLAGFAIRGEADAKRAARAIQQFGPQAVLIKGRQAEGNVIVDGLLDGRTWMTFRHPRLGDRHHHGAGATLSAALTAYLALGETLPDAVRMALDYVHRALAAAPGFAAGLGPLGHRDAGSVE